MAASWKPSSSGMHTSTSTMAISRLSSCSSAPRAELALIRFSSSSWSITSYLRSLAGWSSTSRMLTSSFIGFLDLAMEPHPQRGEQLFGVDRLGEIIGGARLQAFLAVALHGLGGERHDRQPAQRRLGANRLDGLIAIH